MLAATARHFGVTVAAIRSRSRAFLPTRARLGAYLVLRDHLRLSTPTIAFYTHRRDHGTVISGLRSGRSRPVFAAEVVALIAGLAKNERRAA